MATKYNVILLQRAIKEAFIAKDWYRDKPNKALVKFENALEKLLKDLEKLPIKPSRKKYNLLLLKGFPYKIFYIIDENSNTIFVHSIFNTYQNPDKEPK